jgi:IS5 family transposase
MSLDDPVPDEKTIWAYREVGVKGRVIEKLFDRFHRYLSSQGYGAACGSLVDASIVPARRQRNSREDNASIKAGKVPESFQHNVHRRRQKDIDARWTVKNRQAYYGYKSHVHADVKHKLIQSYAVSAANVADNRHFVSLLSGSVPKKTPEWRVWADAAYHSKQAETALAEKGLVSRLIRRYTVHHPAYSQMQREMSRRTKIRKRVEHIFGFIENSMGGKFVRTIGLKRARSKIGLMNLVYNLCRFEQLTRLSIA